MAIHPANIVNKSPFNFVISGSVNNPINIVNPTLLPTDMGNPLGGSIYAQYIHHSGPCDRANTMMYS